MRQGAAPRGAFLRGAWVLVFVVGVAGGDAHAQGPEVRPRAAVMPLQVARLPTEVVSVLDELLLNQLHSLRRFEVVSLSDMNALLGLEKARDLAKCNEIACAVDLGGALGARYLITGSVARLGDQIIITLKLLDTREARVDTRAEVSVDNDEKRYAAGVRAAVSKLLGVEAPPAALATAAPSAAPVPGSRLEITTSPPGATCEIDGKPLGTSPCKVDSLPAGSYTLRLSLVGHDPHTEVLAVVAGKATQRGVELVATPVPVRFVSSPEGAEVSLDGAVIGKTPLTQPVKPGAHQVRIALAAHQPVTQALTVQPASRPADVKASLVPLPGRLVVSATPADADVRVTGRRVREKCTGKCELSLDAGEYDVRIERDGHADVRKTVTVAPGGTTPLSVLLTPTPVESVGLTSARLRKGAVALTVVTALSAGVFAWQGLAARGASDDLRSMRWGSAEAKSKLDAANAASTRADVALAVSALGAIGSAVLWMKVGF